MTAGNLVMVRVYFNEGDRSNKESLAQKLLKELHDQHLVTGATMQRALAGFGSHDTIHEATILHPEAKLPLILEFFDTQDRVSAAIEHIKKFDSLVIISWPIQIH